MDDNLLSRVLTIKMTSTPETIIATIIQTKKLLWKFSTIFFIWLESFFVKDKLTSVTSEFTPKYKNRSNEATKTEAIKN